MSIVLRENPTQLSSLFDDFLSENFFNQSGWRRGARTMPQVNIYETDEDFRVEMAAPGMKKEDFHVELKDDYLKIYSEVEAQTENVNYTLKEFDYGPFDRTFHLPNTVEYDKIKAKYSDGVLSLIIPKKEEAKKIVKTIKIS